MEFRGTKMLNWSLNNYLGLANDPEVRKYDAEVALEYGFSHPMECENDERKYGLS